MERSVAYQLIRDTDKKIVFEGAYTKYYADTPYCAIFERYPAELTRVMICKKIGEEDTSHGYRPCHLISQGVSSPSITIGRYVPCGDAINEKDAEEKVLANLKANILFQNILRNKS